MTEKPKRVRADAFYNRGVMRTFFWILGIGSVIVAITFFNTRSDNQSEINYRSGIFKLVSGPDLYYEVTDEEVIKIGNYLRDQMAGGVSLETLIEKSDRLRTFLFEVETKNGAGDEGQKRRNLAWRTMADKGEIDWAVAYMSEQSHWQRFIANPENANLIEAVFKDPNAEIPILEFQKYQISKNWFLLPLLIAQFVAMLAYLIVYDVNKDEAKKYSPNNMPAKWYHPNWKSPGMYLTVIFFLLPGAAPIILPTVLVRMTIFVFKQRSKASLAGELNEVLEAKGLQRSQEAILREVAGK